MPLKKKVSKKTKKKSLKNPAKAKRAKNPKLHRAIKKGWEKLKRQNNLKYDGVMGTPPEWFPNPLYKEFWTTRDTLLEDYKHKEILRLMKYRRDMVQPDIKWTASLNWLRKIKFTREIYHQIDSLNYIYELVQLGKVDGIKAYLGQGPYEVVRGIVSEESGRRGGETSIKNKEFHVAIEKLKLKNFASILKAFEDEDKMNTLYDSKKINFCFGEIRRGRLNYTQRIYKDGKEILEDKSISISAIKNKYPLKKK